MNKQFITIQGHAYRVEANWRALTSYLAEKGKDTMEGLSDLASLSPTSLAPLMAACITEGERLEGHNVTINGDWVAENCSMPEIGAFITIYIAQTTPKVPTEQSKKE